MVTVACVLRSGGCYNALDVEMLKEGVEQHLPGADFLCFSDVPVPCDRMPLLRDWPGWWSKMEIFNPNLQGDVLYFDLDTIVTGDLSDLAQLDRLAILRDFYRPHGLQSSVMFIPQSEKRVVWDSFMAAPAAHMKRCTTPECWGDQGFLEGLWLDRAARIQDVCPGQLVSYKVDVQGCGVPANARAVIFHGQPKPRDIGWKL